MTALARELARLLPTSVPSVLAFQQLRDALSMSQKQLDAALLPRGGTLAALLHKQLLWMLHKQLL
jgi:hypothetical protein